MIIPVKKIVSMIRKSSYHNHIIQTNPRHRKEELQNTNSCKAWHEEDNLSKAINSLFAIKMIAKIDESKLLNNKTRTKLRTPKYNGSNNEQGININRTTASERTAAYVTGGLKCIFSVIKSSPKILLFLKHRTCTVWLNSSQ